MSRPEEDVNTVEDTEKSEAPVDRVHDNFFSSSSELEDDGTEKEEVN